MRCGGPRHGCFLGMAKPLRGSLMDRPAPCNRHRGDRKSPRIAPGADTPPWKLPNLHSANFDTGSKLLLAFSRQPVSRSSADTTNSTRKRGNPDVKNCLDFGLWRLRLDSWVGSTSLSYCAGSEWGERTPGSPAGERLLWPRFSSRRLRPLSAQRCVCRAGSLRGRSSGRSCSASVPIRLRLGSSVSTLRAPLTSPSGLADYAATPCHRGVRIALAAGR